MATLKVPRSYSASRILLVDDEPEHLDWLVDYLKAKGYETTITTSVRDSINAIEKTTYRAYLVDLNIPFGGWTPTVDVTAPAYADYHGLYVLKLVRSQGNAGPRVVAYSAHSNEQILAEIKRLYCKYVLKGRPRELKEEIEKLLSRDPKTRKPAKPTKTGKKKPARRRRGAPKRT